VKLKCIIRLFMYIVDKLLFTRDKHQKEIIMLFQIIRKTSTAAWPLIQKTFHLRDLKHIELWIFWWKYTLTWFLCLLHGDKKCCCMQTYTNIHQKWGFTWRYPINKIALLSTMHSAKVTAEQLSFLGYLGDSGRTNVATTNGRHKLNVLHNCCSLHFLQWAA